MEFKMPSHLLDRSPDIETMILYWNKVSAILDGYEKIKEEGRTYLPQFPNESDDDYDYRLKVTKFTNVFRDVAEGLATKPFQNEITVTKGDDEENRQIPDFVSSFIEDVDGSGSNLTTFAALSFFYGICYAIDWIFVDYPTVNNPDQLTVNDAKTKNLRPYWVHVLGKNVLDIKTAMVGSKEIITYFRYAEPGFFDQPTRVREYVYNDEEKNVSWFLYIEDKSKDEDSDDRFKLIDKGLMTIDQIPVVPLVIGRRDGKSWKLYPPLQDAADLQITLYQDESALQYVKTLTAYPMLATNGTNVREDGTGKPGKIAVGPNRVLYGIPTDDGRGGDWKYVEPNSNSLEFLQKNIDKTKQDLRELGRQPLTALSSQLTTVTTSIAAGKAKSAVTAWAFLLKDCLENALFLTMKWMGKDYEPQVYVYTGFDDVTESDSDIETLVKAREMNDLSWETFVEELKRRKILSPEFNAEAEKERLLDDVPGDDNDLLTFNQRGNNELET